MMPRRRLLSGLAGTALLGVPGLRDALEDGPTACTGCDGWVLSVAPSQGVTECVDAPALKVAIRIYNQRDHSRRYRDVVELVGTGYREHRKVSVAVDADGVATATIKFPTPRKPGRYWLDLRPEGGRVAIAVCPEPLGPGPLHDP